MFNAKVFVYLVLDKNQMQRKHLEDRHINICVSATMYHYNFN